MGGHTPGPWDYTSEVGGRDIYAADVRTVAVVEYGQPEADARLIAAAPDLLAACLYAERNLGRLAARDPTTGEPCWEVVHSAIDKATMPS